MYLQMKNQLNLVAPSAVLKYLVPILLVCSTSITYAAQCGDTVAGFKSWKNSFAADAKAAGISQKGLRALANAKYSTGTIWADRNQKSFRYTLDKFMKIRGANIIVSKGRKLKAADRNFYKGLENKYGVPAGVIVALHGMETAFGHFMGSTPIVSAITTLAYDCRRSEYFQPHAIGALQLVDNGSITDSTKGAKHGELGHTQFLPGNALEYGVDGNGDGQINFYNKKDALASTANFLKEKGWIRGQGYQLGEPNFAVIKEWNAAGVYQKAIAIMAKKIDG
jgi:membrane-bound lytic murein transglycosylase B